MAKSKDSAEQQTVQDLPPTHPNDPTETTLEQPDAAIDGDAQAQAKAARLGYEAPPSEPPPVIP